MPRPCRGVGENTPPSSVGELRDLLQPGAYAPCAGQGCSAPSTGADSRAYCISHLARRPPSALRSDCIIGRHSVGRCVPVACEFPNSVTYPFHFIECSLIPLSRASRAGLIYTGATCVE